MSSVKIATTITTVFLSHESRVPVLIGSDGAGGVSAGTKGVADRAYATWGYE
jgi:hypothetical protein